MEGELVSLVIYFIDKCATHGMKLRVIAFRWMILFFFSLFIHFKVLLSELKRTHVIRQKSLKSLHWFRLCFHLATEKKREGVRNAYTLKILIIKSQRAKLIRTRCLIGHAISFAHVYHLRFYILSHQNSTTTIDISLYCLYYLSWMFA